MRAEQRLVALMHSVMHRGSRLQRARCPLAPLVAASAASTLWCELDQVGGAGVVAAAAAALQLQLQLLQRRPLPPLRHHRHQH